jgi:hypothetical protein
VIPFPNPESTPPVTNMNLVGFATVNTPLKQTPALSL